MKMSLDELETIIEEVLRDLPEEFSSLLENVAVIAEDEPTEEDLEALDDDGELLGIFRGIAMTERSWLDMAGPNEVVIFRGPLSRVCDSRREMVQEVRDTVIHELGHYFGLDDHGMEF